MAFPLARICIPSQLTFDATFNIQVIQHRTGLLVHHDQDPRTFENYWITWHTGLDLQPFLPFAMSNNPDISDLRKFDLHIYITVQE